MTSWGDDRVVVIGSGPSGAVAAAQLVQRGLNVTMLDSGSHPPRGVVAVAGGNTLFRWRSERELSTDRHDATRSEEVDWYSSLSLGGLSNYWTSAVPRFAPEDFDDGARVDEAYRWPVTYDDLEASYERAERYLTVTAGSPMPGVPPNVVRYRRHLPPDWQSVADAARSNDVGLGLIPMAKGRPWMIALRGAEFSSYHCVVSSLEGSPNFEIRRAAHATEIAWSSSRGAAEAVEYVDRLTGARESVRARAVVVAAGTIDTTMLLLRSISADFPTGLGNTNEVVGRYLHDHPREWWPMSTSRPMRALAHPVYVARAPYDEAAPLMGTSHTIGLTSHKDRLHTFVRGRIGRFGVQVFGTMVPRPEVGVALPTADTDDPVRQRPVISLRYDQDAVDNVVASRERLGEVLGAAGLPIELTGPYHDLRPGSSVHYAGTVRMHDDPRCGVLDRWNRLHDVPNVVVCDMSAFTTGPEKNPTLTAMALAIRAADRLADDLSASPG